MGRNEDFFFTNCTTPVFEPWWEASQLEALTN
jgi:hypothetical protein